MQKTKLAMAALLAVCSLPALAAEPAPDWTFSGNAGLFTDYRFRGISQTNKKAAFQGGFDLGHSSGFYVGNWNSNVDSVFYGGANIEMDFYGGFKNTVGDFGYDVGVLHYYYPGSTDLFGSPKIKNTEVYVGASYGPVSAKVYYPISDFFSAEDLVAWAGGTPEDAAGSYYVDLSGAYDLGNGFGLVGHVGYQKLKGSARLVEIGGSTLVDNYVDWKLGATYALPNGFVLGLSYIDTNRDFTGGTAALTSRKISSSTAVLSLSKTF